MMKPKLSLTSFFSVIFDCIGAFLLATYALIIGPLGFLRGPLALERLFWYFWIFIPCKAMARAVRAAIEWRLGHFEMAIAHARSIAHSVEDYYHKKPLSLGRKRVLTDIYALLTRAYLHGGHIDEAMLIVIRAKKILNIDYLPGLGELDAKTAHLVRAGLAAGKLLDGGGLATMFIKSDTPQHVDGSQQPAEAVHKKNEETASSAHTNSSQELKDLRGAKIIPFPPPRLT